MNKFEINIFEGCGDVPFGIEKEKLVEIMGEPSESELVENLDDELSPDTIYCTYLEKGITFFFEEDEKFLLTCIEIENKETELLGKKIFEMKEDEIVELMKSNNMTNVESEEEEWGEKRISFEEGLVDFYFEDGVLNTVNWSAIIIDEAE